MSDKVKSIYERMNQIKRELSESDIPKSGKNKHLNFSYHELQDFLGKVTSLNYKHGVHEHISMNNELATLTLTNIENTDDKIEISVPFVMADMQPKNDSIQKLGATLTYLRRYLYLQGYAIMEREIVDAQDQSIKTTSAKENQETQQKLLSWLIDKSDKETAQKIIDNVLKEYGLKSISELDFNKINKEELLANIKKQIPKKESF